MRICDKEGTLKTSISIFIESKSARPIAKSGWLGHTYDTARHMLRSLDHMVGVVWIVTC